MEYKAGDDYKADGADYPTYGITCENHTNKIEVHNDEQLRNEILALLNAPQCPCWDEKGCTFVYNEHSMKPLESAKG